MESAHVVFDRYQIARTGRGGQALTLRIRAELLGEANSQRTTDQVTGTLAPCLSGIIKVHNKLDATLNDSPNLNPQLKEDGRKAIDDLRNAQRVLADSIDPNPQKLASCPFRACAAALPLRQ